MKLLYYTIIYSLTIVFGWYSGKFAGEHKINTYIGLAIVIVISLLFLFLAERLKSKIW